MQTFKCKTKTIFEIKIWWKQSYLLLNLSFIWHTVLLTITIYFFWMIITESWFKTTQWCWQTTAMGKILKPIWLKCDETIPGFQTFLFKTWRENQQNIEKNNTQYTGKLKKKKTRENGSSELNETIMNSFDQTTHLQKICNLVNTQTYLLFWTIHFTHFLPFGYKHRTQIEISKKNSQNGKTQMQNQNNFQNQNLMK